MALNLIPFQWNWATIKAGDTYPAATITEDAGGDGDTTLVRVRCKIKDSDGSTYIILDSENDGITINDSSAGAWDFTIESFTAPSVAGIYNLDLEWTDSANVVTTATAGTWEILAQSTD